jgi:hypothetical protein
MSILTTHGLASCNRDHGYGNRLIVSQAPSLGSPLPLVYNPAPQPTMEREDIDEAPGGTGSASPASDVPELECDSDDESDTGASECPTVEDTPYDRDLLSIEKEAFPPSAGLMLPGSTFWIEEDDEDLPELPAGW